MADIEYDFAADASAAERAIARLEQKTERLENQLKRNARTSRRGAQDAQTDFGRMITGAGSLAAGYLSVGAAIGLAGRAFTGFKKEIEDARLRSEKFQQSLLTELTLTGDLALGPEIKGQLQRLPTATEEQGLAAFAGVRGGGPQLDQLRALTLTQDVARMAPLLSTLDPQTGLVAESAKLKELGTLVGELGEKAPEKTPDDLTDLALAMQQGAGRRLPLLQAAGSQRALTFLQQQGMPIERAMAIVLEALEEDVEPASLLPAFAKGVEKGITPEQLLASPELQQKHLQSRQRLAIQSLELEDIDTLEQGFVDAQRQNLAEQQLAMGRLTNPAHFIQQETAIAKQRNFRALAEEERDIDALEAERVEKTAPGSLSRFVVRGEEAFNETFRFMARMLPGDGPDNNVRQLMEERQREQIDLQRQSNQLQQEVLNELRKQPPPRNVNRQAHTE